MNFGDTSAVSSNFISSLWGVNVPPATVTDTDLAKALAPYLGTLPTYATDANGNITSAPFTKNMTVAIANDVQKFLDDLQGGIGTWGSLQADLQAVLFDAQTKQAAVFGQPAPIPAGSGGLSRDTASALGSLISSLKGDGVLSNLSGSTWTVDGSNSFQKLQDWMGSNSNLALIQALQAQLTQDVPTATGTITVNGETQNVQIPLNQSLQSVLQTQYVQQGANIVYSGLQALVDQQQGAEDAINTLNQLQQVYNSIKTIPTTDIITGWSANALSAPPGSPPSEFQTDLADFLWDKAIQGGGVLNFYIAGQPAIPSNLLISINTQDYANASDLSGQLSIEVVHVEAADTPMGVAQDVLAFTVLSQSLRSVAVYMPNPPLTNAAFTSANSSLNMQTANGANFANEFLSFLLKQHGVGTPDSIFNSEPLSTYFTQLNTGSPEIYLQTLQADLANIFFPEPGTSYSTSTIQLNGSYLSTAAGGNMQQLINQIYQVYLNQGAQRLINADSNIIIDPNMTIDNATGRTGYIVKPSVTGDAALISANNLEIIRSVLAFAKGLRVPGGSGTFDVVASGLPIVPLITTPPVSGTIGNLPPGNVSIAQNTATISGQTYTFGFGTPRGGTLENNLLTILTNLVGGTPIIGGSGLPGAIAYDANNNLDLSQWILGIWPTGLGDMPANSPVALDQTQSYLSNAFSAASSVNSQLQQQLQQAFFLFQEFMQSATDTLSQINQEIVKKGQAISG